MNNDLPDIGCNIILVLLIEISLIKFKIQVSDDQAYFPFEMGTGNDRQWASGSAFSNMLIYV